jgi:hypothetical protein
MAIYPQLLTFYLNADPDTVFLCNAHQDPDPASKDNADPDPQPSLLATQSKKVKN